MVNPVNMQLAHWNLEHTAQQHRDPAAAVVQAGQQGEGAAAAVHRDASVQTADHAAEEEKVGIRKKREEQQKDGRRKKRNFSNPAEAEESEELSLSETGGVDFYA